MRECVLSLLGESKRGFFLGELSFVGDLGFEGEPGGVRGGVLGLSRRGLSCSLADRSIKGFFAVTFRGDLRVGGEKRRIASFLSLDPSAESTDIALWWLKGAARFRYWSCTLSGLRKTLASVLVC